MKTDITAVLLLGLSALPIAAQQPDSLQTNASYQCSDGMTVIVTRCARQDAQEYCEFKIEKDGKVAFQGVSLREKVAAGVKSCTAKATSNSPRTMAEPGKSFNPSYLNEMPAVDFVKQ